MTHSLDSRAPRADHLRSAAVSLSIRATSPSGTSRQFALRLLLERSGHRAPELSSFESGPSRRPSIGSITTATCRWATHSEQTLNRRKGWIKPNCKMKAVATKRVIFLVQKSEKGRSRFFSSGPGEVRDGRWSMARVVTAGRKKIADIDLINVRFGPLCGLKSAILRGLRSAMKRREQVQQ